MYIVHLKHGKLCKYSRYCKLVYKKRQNNSLYLLGAWNSFKHGQIIDFPYKAIEVEKSGKISKKSFDWWNYQIGIPITLIYCSLNL